MSNPATNSARSGVTQVFQPRFCSTLAYVARDPFAVWIRFTAGVKAISLGYCRMVLLLGRLRLTETPAGREKATALGGVDV
jgi:hypothetical protein